MGVTEKRGTGGGMEAIWGKRSAGSMGKQKSSLNKIKKAKNKKTKVTLVFDDERRKDFLTGFRKRKNERRRIALEEQQEKERQKKLVERKEKREALKGLLEDTKPLPDFETELKETVDDVKEYKEPQRLTTVTVVKPISFGEEEEETEEEEE
eukprot:Nk52_evm10s805 gene=Nk52_evmTU10s805